MLTLSENEYVTNAQELGTIAFEMSFGEKLRTHRESKRVTTWQVEKVTGVSRANLSSIEKGRRPASDEVLRKLASIPELDITYEQLKAWQRMDGAEPAEKLLILSELLSDEALIAALKARFPDPAQSQSVIQQILAKPEDKPS